jgi:alkylation response protein AidB-like acyl-CoA dehydrogenase
MDASPVLNRLEELLPLVRNEREAIERDRRLPGELVRALGASGVYALGVPRVIGGLEAAPAELMRAIELAATADGSTGWCVMAGVSGNLVAGYMAEAGAREVFADPAIPVAGIAGPQGQAIRVDGGVRVSGRWTFASGITHSAWVWAGAVVMENGKPHMTAHGPEIVHVCLRVAEIEVHDTWNVTGLCGTGSHDFSVSDAFVPAQRIFALLDPTHHRREPLYQMPPLGLYVFELAAVSLGIARCALDELTLLARDKVPTFYQEPLAQRPSAQIALARAEARLAAARALLFASAEDMWQTVRAGRTPTPREIALGRMAATQAVETAAAVTQAANTLAGGAAIFHRTSLQRHARDAEAITHHFTMSPHTWEQAGRVLLGLAPGVPVF